MPWQSHSFSAADKLTDFLASRARGPYLWRGHSRSKWSTLLPSMARLTRKWPETAALIREINEIESFRKHGFEHALPQETPKLQSTYVETISLMRHYGAPTRLLDWTFSPWVAAYFAVGAHPRSPALLWAIDVGNLAVRSRPSRHAYEMLTRSNSAQSWARFSTTHRDFFAVLDPTIPFPRERVQKSAFTVAADIHARHEHLVERVLESEDHLKITIAAEVKQPMLELLRSMNISSMHLFRDLAGLASESTVSVQFNLDMRVPHELDEALREVGVE